MLMIFCLFSCGKSRESMITRMVKDWDGKEILFPVHSSFYVQGRDSIASLYFNKQYRIVTYVDSIGCTSCKLQLFRWKQFMHQIDSLNNDNTSFLFYFHPKRKKEICYILLRDKFVSSICFDENNEFYRLNKFPNDMAFQTFLLDNNNRVLAIGNPIHNSKVKELYLKIIRGDALSKNKKKGVITMVSLDKSIFSMGTFGWEKEQNTTFLLKNIGDKAFVVNDVTTSCGCTSVEYSKEPIRPGKSLALHVTYKADHPGHFDKTVSVYCNVPSSPIQLRINGNAN